MSDNSNPQGTGTATANADQDAFDQFIDSEFSDDPGTNNEDELRADDGDEADAATDEDQDAEDASEEEGEGDDGSETLIKLADGTEVTLKELTEGYSRTADYTRKTQELAAQAKDVAAKMAHIDEQAGVIAKHKQQLEETSEAVLDILAARLPPEPDPNLAFSDPALYMQQRALYDAGIREIQGVMNSMKDKKARIAEAEAQNDQARARVEAQKVVDAFPHIKGNPQKSEQFWKAAFDAGRKIGYTDAELAGISDSRAVIALGKLASYMAREEAAKKAGQSKTVIDKQRPGTIQARKPVGRDASMPKELRAFRETGSVEAAERVLARMDID